MVTKFRERDEEVELEDDERPDPAGDDEDSDDEKPKSKLKKKVKAAVEVEEEEEAPKKKVVKKKVVEVEDEEEETPKSKTKTKAKASAKPKKPRKPRETNLEKYGIPYEPETMIGKGFTLASRKEGVPVERLKALIEKNKQGKKGGYWVLTDLRKGEWRGAKWKVLDDGKESGVLKISFKQAA